MSRLYIKCPACNEGTNAFPDLAKCPCCGGEKYVASGLSEGQFDLYRRKLAEGTNYVGDDPAKPRRIWFRNGRTVTAYAGKDTPYLVVEWDSPGSPFRLREGLCSSPLDEDDPIAKPAYVVTMDVSEEYQAWKCQDRSIARVGGRETDLSDAWFNVLIDLGYHVAVIEKDDDEDDFRAGCPTFADFGLDEKQEAST